MDPCGPTMGFDLPASQLYTLLSLVGALSALAAAQLDKVVPFLSNNMDVAQHRRLLLFGPVICFFLVMGHILVTIILHLGSSHHVFHAFTLIAVALTYVATLYVIIKNHTQADKVRQVKTAIGIHQNDSQ